MSDLENPIFHDAEKAREWLEARIWANGRACPHCGVLDCSTALDGKSHRKGLYQCNQCREQFTVTVGTLFERSKIPLNKWMLAVYLLSASKKGMSAHQLHRMLGVTYKTAWFMCHRIREALREGKFSSPLGGEGKVVEVDETYIGGKERNKHVGKRNKFNIGGQGKEIAFSLVERNGNVRSFHIPSVAAKNLRPILMEQIHKDTRLITDDAGQYRHMHKDFKHDKINHSIDEYVRGDVYTNTIEGYFSILKRGITGVYHHVSQQHLKRYLGEFDFRYNTRTLTDMERTTLVAKGISGKRLTYRRDDERAASNQTQA